MARLTLLKRMKSVAREKWVDVADGRSITAHDLRATFRTWAEEVTGFPHAMIEETMGNHGRQLALLWQIYSSDRRRVRLQWGHR
jgi:integrase